MRRRADTALTLVVIALVATGAGCRNEIEGPEGTPGTATRAETAMTIARRPFSTLPQRFPLYEPPTEEPYANGKRLAGRVAQQLATFPPHASTAEIARGVRVLAGRRAELSRTVAPLLDPRRRSAGEVVYVQLSGVTATTLGAMVVVRQHLEDAAGNRQWVVRVMDVRLRRTDGPWSLERVASVGGTAVRRPANVSPAEARVLDHSDIELPDTARWDIYRGWIDDRLLRALADAADRWPLAVAVLRTGHPVNVWATKRPSAHASGYAADVYAVDGRLVLRQRKTGSSAQQFAAAFLAAGARQVGSPWNLTAAGKRSFTDRVHQDHVHAQFRRVPEPRRRTRAD